MGSSGVKMFGDNQTDTERPFQIGIGIVPGLTIN
jgi:hypothetical protein